MTETAAGIRDSLAAADRTQLGILAGDAADAGALNLYGPAYALPSRDQRIERFADTETLLRKP